MQGIFVVAIAGNERSGSMQSTGDRGARTPEGCEAALFNARVPHIIQGVPWNSSECKGKENTETILASGPSPSNTSPQITCCVFPIATKSSGNSTTVKMEKS